MKYSKMKTFFQWAEENDCELPLIQDVEERPSIEEKTKRGGISNNYPDAYAGKKYAYPDLYFTPISANAPGKLAGKMGS